MICGVGTDIVEVHRIRRILSRYGTRFAGRILTRAEQRDMDDELRFAAYLSRQFAAKEAISKALGSGMRDGVHFRSIEVTRNKRGAPVVALLTGAADYARQHGIESIQVSLSDEKEYALAFAIATSVEAH